MLFFLGWEVVNFFLDVYVVCYMVWMLCKYVVYVMLLVGVCVLFGMIGYVRCFVNIIIVL